MYAYYRVSINLSYCFNPVERAVINFVTDFMLYLDFVGAATRKESSLTLLESYLIA